MASIYRHRTANGLEVVGYYLPGNIAAAGINVGMGSVREDGSNSGVSHVIEQAAFDAPGRWRAGADLREALAENGLRPGTALNPEWTRYWIVGLAEDLPAALGLLADGVLSPDFDDARVAAAKASAQGRLRRRHEQRERYVTDLLRTGIYPGHPLASPIMGTSAGIDGLGTDDVAAFHARHHQSGNMILGVAGQFDWDRVVEFAEARFPAAPAGRSSEGAGSLSLSTAPLAPVLVAPARIGEVRAGAQQHIAIALPGPAYPDRRFYTWAAITQLLGADQTSLLFRRVREEQGMTYAVSARMVAHSCAGETSICGTTTPERAAAFVGAVIQTVRDLASHGLTAAEIATAKAQLGSELVMRGESSVARLHTVLTSVFFTGHARGIEEIAALIDLVTADDVAAALGQWRDPQAMGLATVGPVPAKELSDALEPAVLG
jgi:predicted Zn-dependent peptidase